MEQRRFIQGTGPNAFRFGHALIRMAAYQSITREDRAALHERFADWLGRTSPHSTPEFHEVLGYHLEQAMDHRRASGIGGAAGARRSRARAVASRSTRPANLLEAFQDEIEAELQAICERWVAGR